MLLCDIGNTHLHFWENGKIHHVLPKSLHKRMFDDDAIYYISVNPAHEKLLNKVFKTTYDLESIIHLPSEYKGLGVDRRAACICVNDGVVVDVGSAITVDVMSGGKHCGGYILPGLNEFLNAYARISPALKCGINFGLEPKELPLNTKDAITYGILKSTILTIQNTIGSKKAYFTGGDGKYLAKFFAQAIYDETLVFRGMRISIERALEKHRRHKAIQGE
ncbi:pantothenate kinase [Helicobacter sp. CLO-3]|uniref:type III pantothenate kinase n=1 Tax=unclassified Helicobacter TaxID=2593540 RepID=UPI00080599E6|nr:MULTISPECIES: type III pantothenate kinase [unclassified Helicobacter]OBV29497.1 pantothenate kinase [Helicobacter sp. CLO-3]OHU83069.1 pantothenate kinase [Helicobacter sp. CLO-3]